MKQHITDETFTYQCQECGEIKADSNFESTGMGEICKGCEVIGLDEGGYYTDSGYVTEEYAIKQGFKPIKE